MRTIEKRTHFGRILCELRKNHELSGREVSRLSGIPQSHISKFETGKLSPSTRHLAKLSRALNLSAEEKTRLYSWQRLLDHDFSPFLLSSELQLAENQNIIRDLEDRTTALRAYQCYVVPGLLQTKGYIQEIFRSEAAVNRSTIERAIALRLKRQKVLTASKKKFSFVIHEMALQNRMGNARVMKAQLRHLANLSEDKSIELGVIPRSSYWRGELPTTSYDIFDEELVLIECHAGLLYLWMPEIIKGYHKMHRNAVEHAIRGDAMRNLLLRLEREIE